MSDLNFWHLLIIYFNRIYYGAGLDCKYLNFMSVTRHVVFVTDIPTSAHLRILGEEGKIILQAMFV